ncbi:glutathione S-transferase [Leeia oryzae]|uniref:glutathione S-transferase n=1 Tax=Leeia oryzae TaxID=356662 RepID=UPI0003796515|nr:glutathione S-transferase [Leeia oryzae]
MPSPILYSYRRCPYAMRARMALKYCNLMIEVREISLRDKPAHMLENSPKGTVPVLVLPDQQVLEQSLDIMHWALSQHDPAGWVLAAQRYNTQALIATNDGPFKAALDRYKYPDRYPDRPQADYRAQGEVFLAELEARLNQYPYLFGPGITLADIAIFPFVRQFSKVDSLWFEQADYPKLKAWLSTLTTMPLFDAIMHKYPTWQPGQAPAYL